MSHRSKRDGNTLEERTAADLTTAHDGVVTRGKRSTFPLSHPALCVHPQPCATIPGALVSCSSEVPPRRALYSTSTPVSKTLEATPR
jgi:hypothetical protein